MKYLKYLLIGTILLVLTTSPVFAKPEEDKDKKVTIIIGDEVRGTEADLFTWTYARDAYEWTQNEGKFISYILVWAFNTLSEQQAQIDDLTKRVEALEAIK